MSTCEILWFLLVCCVQTFCTMQPKNVMNIINTNKTCNENNENLLQKPTKKTHKKQQEPKRMCISVTDYLYSKVSVIRMNATGKLFECHLSNEWIYSFNHHPENFTHFRMLYFNSVFSTQHCWPDECIVCVQYLYAMCVCVEILFVMKNMLELGVKLRKLNLSAHFKIHNTHTHTYTAYLLSISKPHIEDNSSEAIWCLLFYLDQCTAW